MKLALLPLATLAIASPVDGEPRAEYMPRDNSQLDERMLAGSEFQDWYGRDGKDICLMAWRNIAPHDCSVGCWNEGYKYFDMTYGPHWCCCWARRW